MSQAVLETGGATVTKTAAELEAHDQFVALNHPGFESRGVSLQLSGAGTRDVTDALAINSTSSRAAMNAQEGRVLSGSGRASPEAMTLKQPRARPNIRSL